MKKFDLLAASALALVTSIPAHAQTGATTSSQNTAPTNGPGQEAPMRHARHVHRSGLFQGHLEQDGHDRVLRREREGGVVQPDGTADVEAQVRNHG